MKTTPTSRLIFAATAICLITLPADAQELKTATATQAAAIKKYPELGKVGSAFNKSFVARVARLREELPAFFNDPNWPMMLADEVASPESLKKIADEVLSDCQLIYEATNRWATEHKKGAGTKVAVDDLKPYIQPGARLQAGFQEGHPRDALGNPIDLGVVDWGPLLSYETFSRLSPVADSKFWGRFTVARATLPPEIEKILAKSQREAWAINQLYQQERESSVQQKDDAAQHHTHNQKVLQQLSALEKGLPKNSPDRVLIYRIRKNISDYPARGGKGNGIAATFEFSKEDAVGIIASGPNTRENPDPSKGKAFWICRLGARPISVETKIVFDDKTSAVKRFDLGLFSADQEISFRQQKKPVENVEVVSVQFQ